MGGRYHVYSHLVLCLRGVCRGCVCPADCRLAGQWFPAYGCAGTGFVVTARYRWFDSHSDRGSQYLSIRLSAWRRPGSRPPWEVWVIQGVYDNALAETIIGLYKTEVIRKRGPWTLDDVEYATLEWVDWFNHRRLLAPIGNV